MLHSRVYKRQRRAATTTEEPLSMMAITTSEQLPPSPKIQKATQTIFWTRTSSMGLYNLVQQLSSAQREAVRAIGFGGLLSLALSKCPGEISRHIVRSFDCSSCSIILQNGEAVRIEEEDVHCVLGLPRGHLKIIESTKTGSSSQYAQQLKDWRRRWGILQNIGGPKTTEMPKRILENRAADNNFKIDFVVYVVSSFLWTSQNQQCRFKILRSIFDVKNINKLNWCKFTIDGLLDACKKWKHNEKSHFHGPHTFLLLCYIDRVAVPQLQLYYERKFPILSCWNDNTLRNRIEKELGEGGFGLGRDIGRLSLSSTHEDEIADEVAYDGMEDEGVSESAHDGREDDDRADEGRADEGVPHKLFSVVEKAFMTIATSAKNISKGTQVLADVSTSQQQQIDPSVLFNISIHCLYEAMDTNKFLRDAVHKYFTKTLPTEEPEVEVVIEPEVEVEGDPDVVMRGEPEAVMRGEPEAVVGGEPEAVVGGEPEAVVGGEPEAVVEREPEVVVEREPEVVEERESEVVVVEREPKVVQEREPLVVRADEENDIVAARILMSFVNNCQN